MDARPRTLTELFQGDRQFRIPLYQRSYVWDMDRQWEPLWEDVARTAERTMSSSTGSPVPHFLGAIVVSQVPQPTGDLDARDVIDGQQRLTTLQLLMDAVEEVLREEGYNTQSRRLHSLVLNDRELFRDDDLFKVRPTNADQEAWRRAMDNDRTIVPEIEGTNIVRAHEYFKECTREWLKETEPEIRQNRCEAIVSAIRKHLCVIVIDLKENDNHHAVFETLNARGTPLLASDLVKNHVLHEATRMGLDAESIYGTYWRHFEDPWWHEEITLGRLRWPRLDAFLYYLLGMHLAQDINTQQLFSYYRDWVKDNEHGPEFVASCFASLSGTFRSLEEEHHNKLEERFFERRDVLGLGVLTPFLLWLYGQQPGVPECVPVDVRKGCLQTLESWFMRRMICGHRAQGYQDFLSSTLRDLKAKPTNRAFHALSQSLQSAWAAGTKWPDDNEVEWAVINRRMFNYSSQPRLRLVLEALEEEARREAKGKAEVEDCPRNLTIEHIMPVSWSDDSWPLPKPHGDNLDPLGERERLLHTLGNLTLVNNKLNPALSNASWEKKREELKNHSVLFLNKELLGRREWNETSIRDRGRALALRLCRIWRRDVMRVADSATDGADS